MGNVILPTKECDMRNLTELAMAMAAGLFLLAAPIEAKANNDFYTENEILNAARGFFGETSGGLAAAVEKVFSELGRPSAYIIGE